MTYSEAINSSKAVLVEFYATWCPHCQKMMPVVEQIKELLNGRANVYQLDIDKNSKLADEEGVTSVPTFIIYQDGKSVLRHTGEIEDDSLLQKVETELFGLSPRKYRLYTSRVNPCYDAHGSA